MAELNIIPRVNEWRQRNNKTVKVALPISYMGFCPEAEEGLFDLEKDTKGQALLLIMEGEEIPDEGYELEIDTDKILLHYADDFGRIYGLTTLFEMIRVYKGEIPCGHVSDAPRLAYRGFMLDVSRHFFGVEEVKKILDEMAALKLNEFHWHLSDDQGFRIESKKFPKLNEIGSYRTENDGTVTGGYYTQEEIQDIVDYADLRGIEVIPEIDLPGHTSAIIAAYPELSCDKTPGEVKTTGGIFTHILCPGKDETVQFLYDLLDEIVPLFPGRFFHIGGDEAPKAEWEKCPDCQARMKAEGLKDTEELQGWLTNKLIDHLEKMDKMVIGWNEMLYSGAKLNAIGQYWAEMGPSKMAGPIAEGQEFIFSNNGACYCDYPYGMVTLRGTYSFGGKTQQQDVPEEQVFGLEAPVWTEYIADTDRLEKQIFPRLQALAENAWSEEHDFEDWKERMKDRESYLMEKGYAVTPVEEADIHTMEDVPKILQSVAEFVGRMGGAGAAQNLPPEVQEQIQKGMQNFLKSFFQYVFTEEEIQKILVIFQQAVANH